MASTNHYPEAFVEQALFKVFARGERTIEQIAHELNVPFHTLKHWMTKEKTGKRRPAKPQEKRPQDWGPEEQLMALHETHGLEQEALQAWCRERGLFTHHLESWKLAFCAIASPSAGSLQRRELQEENLKLKRELARKEKALVEAAALLVLQKKFQALWADGEK
jgi:hypothetical protein